MKYLRFIIPIAILCISWQFLSGRGVNATLLPGPVVVIADLVAWARSGALLNDLGASLARVLTGFFFGSVLGLLAGIITGSSKFVDNALGPIVELLRPIPPLAWIPLSILWFGIGNSAAAFLVSLGAFFPLFSGTRRGIASIQKYTIETSQLFQIPTKRYLAEIAIPQVLPSIVSSAIVGLGVSWMIVITAELVGAQSGLGYAIQVARIQLETDRVISGMLVIGGVGFILTQGMKKLEALLCPWVKSI
jgi:ABC-type nitrate/sulfonate/bicarbonate transport system permease component